MSSLPAPQPSISPGLPRLGASAWAWALIPLLAVAAYGSALRVGFLAEDFLSLDIGRQLGFDPQLWRPGSTWPDYRPVGDLLTFVIGWRLWGDNPLPYHVAGLLLHAGVALLLGLWLGLVLARPLAGWLAGALFAVYPTHTEAVAWVAAYYDLLAPLFFLGSLLAFTLSTAPGGGMLRRSSLYLLSLFLYACAVYTKESVYALLPLYLVSAWLYRRERDQPPNVREMALMLAALVPLGLVLLSNLALRFVFLGNLGGYQGTRSDYTAFFWDSFVGYARVLLAPVSSAAVGKEAAQAVGALFSLLFLVGLTALGPRVARVLLLSGLWMGLAFLPVINLTVAPGDLQNNRYLYLVAAGWCVGLGALLSAFVSGLAARSGGGGRKAPLRLAQGAIAVLLGLLAAICWLHLRPWHTASDQVRYIIDELARAIPPQSQPEGMAWYIENTPYDYKGAMVFRRGIGRQRTLFFKEGVRVTAVDDATLAPIAADPHPDAFALRYGFDAALTRFRLDYAAGITHPGEPPVPSDPYGAGERLRVWDFRGCEGGTLGAWVPLGGGAPCERERGIVSGWRNSSLSLLLPSINEDLAAYGAGWVRLRVAARYSFVDGVGALSSQARDEPPVLTWQAEGRSEAGDITGPAALTPLRLDGSEYIYWAFIPTSEVGVWLESLRFYPSAGSSPIDVEVRWIALDLLR